MSLCFYKKVFIFFSKWQLFMLRNVLFVLLFMVKCLGNLKFFIIKAELILSFEWRMVENVGISG